LATGVEAVMFRRRRRNLLLCSQSRPKAAPEGKARRAILEFSIHWGKMRSAVIAYFLVAAWSASVSVSSAQVSCQQLGNRTVCNNGQTFQRFGNRTYDNRGNSWQQFGNQIYGSDGSTYQQFRNQTYDNRGNSWQQFGNQTYSSNGRSCQRFGNKVYCN
jgi:hypothetical protein